MKNTISIECATVLSKGAEALIYKGTFLVFPAVFKERLPKKYRMGSIDNKIRSSRLRSEAKLLVEAKNIGINVPSLLGVDFGKKTLIIEYIEGLILYELLHIRPSNYICSLMKNIGKQVGILHKNNIIHGDLTVFNVVIKDNKPYIIDFGLGKFSDELEKKADDVLTFQNTLKAVSKDFSLFMKVFFEGYRSSNSNIDLIIQNIQKIQSRARYIGRKDRLI